MSETPSIEERLEYLEDQNEGLKRVGLLLVVLVILMGVTMIYQSNSASQALRSDGLIFSQEGRSRSALTTMPNGHVGMVFFDQNENISAPAQFESVPYLDGLVIYDHKGVPRILLGLDENENPILAAIGKDGRTLFSAIDPALYQAGRPASQQPQPAASPAPASSPEPVATPSP